MAEVAARFAAERAPGVDALPPHFSEEALAWRFLRRYENGLRYVARWDRWMCWDGTRWREDDTLAVFDRCRAICRSASAELRGHQGTGCHEDCNSSNGCCGRTAR